ncbi:DUF2851 family protein [Prevotella aurantiaca]|uniref:DUF2851 family protein n=1 Tax=Prevotella aurantiaca TaxID=596085 RepID=UPI0023F18810
MEKLIHYVWKHKLFPLAQLATTDGQSVEVIDAGLPNSNAGPDFFNAKVKINGTLWVGNVEIHDKSSDWFTHGHDTDTHYNNVVLHVVEHADMTVTKQNGDTPPQLVLPVPESVKQHYAELLTADAYPPCYKIVPGLSKLMIHSWLSALQTERLEQRTIAITERLKACDGNWEVAYFVSLARNFGFGINGDAFEQWAKAIPFQAVAHHRNDLFQIETIFMGQAGLLNVDTLPKQHRDKAIADEYFQHLQIEYKYLAHKFSLTPMDAQQWRFLRLRPQNFPYIRIAQLAQLYYNRQSGLGELLDCTTIKEVEELLQTKVTPYWETHYTFGSNDSKQSNKNLSKASLELIIINTVVPILFAYGRYRMSEKLCDRAFAFLEALKAENNHIVRMWKEVGLTVESAGDSQALIQLKKDYCDRKECLRCRIGYEYLKQKKQEQ